MLSIGDTVERYRIVGLLGEGGMAKVYRARHTTLGSDHAIKVLTLTGPSLKERLYEEGRVQAQLLHPNIVRVSDVLDVEGMPGLVMDFVDGPDLHTWIRTEKPDAQLAEEVFRGILAGVRAAHARDMIHRDLKPANVLLATAPDGSLVPKVADFGLVKALAGDSATWKTRSGIPMGTPTYMAPEQIRDAANVDHRADLFSLGCILYELLGHRVAFEAPDLVAIFERVQRGDRAPLPASTPARLVRVVDACLQTDPAARPDDCDAIQAMLDGPAHPELPKAPPLPTLPGSAGSPWVVAPLALVGLASLGTGFVVLVLVSLLVFGRTGSEDEAADTGVAVAEPTPGEPEDDPDAADDVETCSGRDGVVIGYANAKPFFQRQGQVWTLLATKSVYDDYPREGNDYERGEVICRLESGTPVELVEAPIRVRGWGHWIPIVGGAIR